MTAPARITIRRNAIAAASGLPPWVAQIVRGTASITSAYPTQPAAMADIPALLTIMDAPPRPTARVAEEWA